MTKASSRLAWWFVAAAIVGGGLSAAAPGPADPRTTRISSVQVDGSGGVARLVVVADGPLTMPKVLAIKEPPYRVVVDFPGVLPRVPAVTNVRVPGIQRIRVATYSTSPLVTRLVVDLEQLLRFGVDATGLAAGRVVIIFDAAHPVSEQPAAEPAAATARETRPPAAPPPAPPPAPPQAAAQPAAPPAATPPADEPAAAAPAAPVAAAPPAAPPAAAPMAAPAERVALETSLARLGEAAGASPAASDYVIGPMDVLAINVWGLADLSGKYPVDADGTISFPLVPRIRAAGLKPREVEAELRGQLASRYFRNPQVTATVEQYHSQAVFVLGEVRRPGSYALTARMTLADALGRAGSTTSNASQQAIIIRALPDRGSDGSARPQQPSVPEVVKVDLRNLQRGGSQNPLLRDRDTIYVLAR